MSAGMCTCAAGCDRTPLTDPGVFRGGCRCWCHDPALKHPCRDCRRPTIWTDTAGQPQCTRCAWRERAAA
jgi:hypothetical protein